MTDIFPPHSGQNFGVPSGWWPQPVQVSLGGAVDVGCGSGRGELPTAGEIMSGRELDGAKSRRNGETS